MTRSESIKEISPAFLAAQQAMHAASKDSTNPHFGSKYSDFASVIDAVKGPLNEQGIAFLQPVRLTEAGVEIETVLMHKSGEFYSDTLTIPLQRRDAQGVGSAISYGKRYGLQAMCGLPSEDDDGNGATAPEARQQTKQPPKQRDALDDDKQFKAAVGSAFKARGFTLTQQGNALAAWREKQGISTATAADLDARHKLIDAIGKGAFDKFKAPKEEAAV